MQLVYQSTCRVVVCFIFSTFTSFSSLELVSLSHSRKHCVLRITVIRNMPTAPHSYLNHMLVTTRIYLRPLVPVRTILLLLFLLLVYICSTFTAQQALGGAHNSPACNYDFVHSYLHCFTACYYALAFSFILFHCLSAVSDTA